MTIDAQNSTVRRGGGKRPLDGWPGRGWRRLWTLLSFSLFAAGALLFGLLFFPLLWLALRNRERRERIARAVIARAFGWFIAFMGLAVLSWETRNMERIRRYAGGQVVVANHPTLIDAVFLMWLLPGADCVVKASHWRNPLMMFAVRAAGYLPNNDDERLLTEGVRRVRAGGTLLLFPQGTRSRPGDEPAFRRGGAVIAARAEAPLQPVRIRCEPPALRKGERWLSVPSRRGHFTITALEPLPVTSALRPGESERRGTRRLTEALSKTLLEGVN